MKLLADGLCFPEGPRWHEGRLFFSDMHGAAVWSLELDGRLEKLADVAPFARAVEAHRVPPCSTRPLPVSSRSQRMP